MKAENSESPSIQPSNSAHAVEHRSFMTKVFEWILLGGISFTFLWNWDGFWQTDIRPLNQFLIGAFPEKVSEEQAKTTNMKQNSAYIEMLQEKYDRVLINRDDLETKLDEIRTNSTEKCEYLDSAIRMFDIATRDLSPEAKAQKIACTNSKCDDIMTNRSNISHVCSGIAL
ncbi:hypothetical protein [Alcanivorax sp. P2S70]|uniref:hypothetical protein n=1 Tax=Alcanivorax sp. P2S70 TaxID=1397527 RepID=UPI0012689C28|nr:hypothetical protein [Alcanivorax sp. P2S70]